MFGSSSVVISTLVAIALNLILPKDPPEDQEVVAVKLEADEAMIADTSNDK